MYIYLYMYICFFWFHLSFLTSMFLSIIHLPECCFSVDFSFGGSLDIYMMSRFLSVFFCLPAIAWSHTLYMWSATLHLDLLCLSVTLPTFYLGLFICPCTYVHPDTHTLTCILTFIRVHAHAHIYICALSPTLSHICVLCIFVSFLFLSSHFPFLSLTCF